MNTQLTVSVYITISFILHSQFKGVIMLRYVIVFVILWPPIFDYTQKYQNYAIENSFKRFLTIRNYD